jgi:hypothetical protein
VNPADPAVVELGESPVAVGNAKTDKESGFENKVLVLDCATVTV